ncbi:MAG TPA: acyl-CoA dehydrogenase family protein [Candidatus Binatia bacterium]|nr:acyl-CoA dehydrogenase family protein [Candidatus Binatia bacterium]
MDLELTPDQRLLRDNARRFLEREVAPRVARHEADGIFPRDLYPRLVAPGFIGAMVPAEHGGHGLDATSYCVLVEELAYCWGSLRSSVTTHNLATGVIAHAGTPAQRARHLPPLLDGRRIAFFGLTEPNVGSDASGVELTATRHGDAYRLSGTKTLITNGTVAETGVVFARLRDAGPTAFIVDREESPFAARALDKMGNLATPLAELAFEDVPVPAANLLGEPGSGLALALRGLATGRCSVAFAAVGLARAALDAAVRYAKERRQFGKPIGAFQLVQEMIAEMAGLTEAARLMAYRAAAALEAGGKAVLESSQAKLFATEAGLRVAHLAIQVHGGYGYTREFPVERYYRDLRHLTLAEGTSQIQHLVIGRELLGLDAIR